MASPYAFDEHPQIIPTEKIVSTLTSRILLAAAREPNALAVVSGNTTLSYRQLIDAAANVAIRLRNADVRKEEAIAVLANRDAEFVVAILGIMLAGCCYIPVDPALPSARFQQIIKKANIRILLGSASALSSIVESHCACIVVTHHGVASVEWIDDALEAGLAYQLFTSGSTGGPNLVAIEHRSVCALLDGFNDVAGVENHASTCAIGSFSFDVSVWELFSALTSGGALHILPGDFARDPEKFSRYIAENGISTAYIPPAVLDSFIDEICIVDDVVKLQCILVGVEPIMQSTLQKLRDKYPEMRIINAYGPTEATICATMFPFFSATDLNARTPIGWAIPGWEVLVVDEGLASVKDGEVGEILIGGIGLARGYVGSEEADTKFITRQGSCRFYRTGDLARVLPGGALEFVGRGDQQVKIRGFRVEPMEIENALMRHPNVTRAITVVTGNADGRRLYAFAEGLVTAEALRCHVKKALPEYMLPSRIISVASFPVTAHGKIDKAYLLSQARKRPINYPAHEATNPFEKTLADVWCEVLDIESVGITDNFFDLGGDSLLALLLAKRLSHATGIRTGAFLPYHTIAEAVAALHSDAATNSPSSAATFDFENQPAPLSFGQEGLWTYQKFHPENLAFILPFALRIQGDIALVRIEQGIAALMQKHEIFFLEYQLKTRKLAQVTAAKSLPVNVVCTAHAGERLDQELQQLFLQSAREISKLNSVPVRIHVVRASDNFTILLFVFHHMVIDGNSIPLLVADIASLIGDDCKVHHQIERGPRYFASVQRSHVGGAEWARMKEHWCRQLTPQPGVLSLSKRDQVKKSRSAAGSSRVVQILSDRCLEAIKHHAQENGTTAYTVVLAGMAMLAHRISGQDDFVISAPFSMRHTIADIDETIGYFVNILPLRFQPTAAMQLIDFVRNTQMIQREAQANAAFPFEAIVQSLDWSHQEALSLSRLVVAQEMPSGLPFKSAEIELHGVDIRQESAMYELAVFVPANFYSSPLRWEFDSAVFDSASIQFFQCEFEKILLEAAPAL
jgi:amino acid adenylation domain-containing protein